MDSLIKMEKLPGGIDPNLPRGDLRSVGAAARMAESLKTPQRMSRMGQLACTHLLDASHKLYGLRRSLPQLKVLFAEKGARDTAAGFDVPTGAAALSARVRLHRPPKASVHAREERRGGYLLYVPESWDGVTALPLGCRGRAAVPLQRGLAPAAPSVRHREL